MSAIIDERKLLDEQIAYYHARAAEYDDWYWRRGRYDRGAQHTAQWEQELEVVRSALTHAQPRGQTLELACGTGLWTGLLAAKAHTVTAVDASAHMLHLNRRRVPGWSVTFVHTDIFAWRAPRSYDFVFFSFWLSHVPPERFTWFWSQVMQWLSPGGTVFFVDSAYSKHSMARDHHLGDEGEVLARRRLNDGREFTIVKVFYTPESLTHRLHSLGWQGHVYRTDEFFLYGEFTRCNNEPAY